MPGSSSPFDDDAPTPARRVRRPWWRWNIITLAVVLFVLVWVRELLGFGPSATWACVLSIFLAWAIGPAFFVPTALTTMAELPPRSGQANESNAAPTWYRRNWMLAGLRLFALVTLLLSLTHLVLFVGWLGYEFLGNANYGYGLMYFPWERALIWGYPPLLEIFFSGCLYALAVIAMRLDREYRDQ